MILEKYHCSYLIPIDGLRKSMLYIVESTQQCLCSVCSPSAQHSPRRYLAAHQLSCRIHSPCIALTCGTTVYQKDPVQFQGHHNMLGQSMSASSGRPGAVCQSPRHRCCYARKEDLIAQALFCLCAFSTEGIKSLYLGSIICNGRLIKTTRKVKLS